MSTPMPTLPEAETEARKLLSELKNPAPVIDMTKDQIKAARVERKASKANAKKTFDTNVAYNQLLATKVKNYLQANKNSILKGVATALVVAAVPAALFFFAPAALLSVGSLALSLVAAAQTSVTATLAIGALLVATGVAALVRSTVTLAKFVASKLPTKQDKVLKQDVADFVTSLKNPEPETVVTLGSDHSNGARAIRVEAFTGLKDLKDAFVKTKPAAATAVAQPVTVMAPTGPAQGVVVDADAEGDAAEESSADRPRQ